ncbi:hypothetical protein ACFW4X_09425 [Streptomyces smyrnaeus]|uniref:hypothetical protein n=1 Tax=Streptomyces smyrnaeus TaxID=1387713 RepID=UPI0033FC3262
MAKLIYIPGVRASGPCQMRMKDLHWEAGDFGRFVVQGKGARGAGPRQREAGLFAEGRELLWWYVEEVRGLFSDDPEHPDSPVWPSFARSERSRDGQPTFVGSGRTTTARGHGGLS